jgi:hypothetical protein
VINRQRGRKAESDPEPDAYRQVVDGSADEAADGNANRHSKCNHSR